MLEFRGAWPEALAEARHACDRLAAPVNPAALSGACVIEGDLLRLIGDFDGAEASYRRATELGRDPQPGVALLRFALGQVPAADAMIRRALGETGDPMSRARLLSASVEIVLAAGDIAAAGAAADELRVIAAELGSPFLRAHAARATGAVLLAEHDSQGRAHRASRRLQRVTTHSACAYEAAQTRLLIADCVRQRSATTTRPQLETSAARAVLESLGATTPSTIASRADTAADALTPRELEVLALLAQGKTNRTIAHELYISEKTVASHVSHIFTKLGIGSRSAATAYAYDHHLV